MEEETLKDLSANCEVCITKPCQIGCPLNNDIPKFIKHIQEKDYESAYLTMSKTTTLLSICSRVCPTSEQCENSCVKKVSFTPVQIGELERIIGDMGLDYSWNIPSLKITNHSVAIIGSGPSSLTCAAFLRRNGIAVTIFEKESYLGGLLARGIPDFRLPKEIVNKEIAKILNEGIKVEYNKELGKDIFLQDLEKKYDAIFIGIGANNPNRIVLKGSQKKGVYYANEFLANQETLNFKEKTVMVYGGGNTAVDIARLSKKMGANKVFILYRKEEKYLSAFESEIQSAKEEGIEFLFQTCITEIKGKEKVEKIVIQKTILKDNELTLVDNSQITLDCDYVFLALGAKVNKITSELGLEIDESGKIKINMMGETSHPKVYAGGDVAGIKNTVAYASRSGRNAAYAITLALKGESKYGE